MDTSIIEQAWLEVYGEDMRSEYPGFFNELDRLNELNTIV